VTTQCSKRFEHKTKFVPYLLNNNQRQNQLSVCNDLQNLSKKNRNFLYRAVTVDERWVYGHEAVTIHHEYSSHITGNTGHHESQFQILFQQWKRCWAWCRNSEGDYFGLDNKAMLYCPSVKTCRSHIICICACFMN
jgi:hypothetical protein